MTSRSGSSLVASIFEAHGLYNGNGKDVVTHGYHVHENREVIERLNPMLHRTDPYTRSLQPGLTERDFLRVFEERIPPNRPWMMKVGIELLPLYRHAFPASRCAFIYRPPESIVNSLVAKTGADRKEVDFITRGRLAMIQQAAALLEAPIINTERLARGDLGQLKEAFKSCGMKLDEQIAKQRFAPRLWRF